MKCTNCLTEIPDGTRICTHCEAEISPAPTPDQVKELLRVFASATPIVQQALIDTLQGQRAIDDAIREVEIGHCPTCGSNHVRDCEDVEGINDSSVGICFACGQRWCLDCGALFVEDQTGCAHWDICDACEFKNADGDCPLMPWDCEHLAACNNGLSREHLPAPDEPEVTQEPAMPTELPAVYPVGIKPMIFEEWKDQCAWCGQAQSFEPFLYFVKGKARLGTDVSGLVLCFVRVELPQAGRSVCGLFAPIRSDSNNEGITFFFSVCSHECQANLTGALLTDDTPVELVP